MLRDRVGLAAVFVALLTIAACTSEREEPVNKAPPPAVAKAPDPERPAPKAETAPAVPTLNKLAPEITGEDIDGRPIKLSDYRGKVVMLDFWGNW